MSLLLDALRRAEEDSRKRKLDASATGAGPSPMATVGETPEDPAQTSGAELTLQAQTPPSSPTPEPAVADAQASTAPPPPAPAPGMDFPDLTLVPDEPATAPLPQAAPVTALADARTPIQPYGRYARPTGAEAGQSAGPAAGGWAAAQAAREPVRPSTGPFAARAPVSQAPEITPAAAASLDRVAPIPGTTQRQAISAASAMAGARARKVPNKQQQRRQWLLAVVALVVALPLAAFLLFGDAIFGSSSTLAAGKPRLPGATPQVAAPEAPTPPPAELAASGNLPAAAGEIAGAAGADKSAPAAPQPVAGTVLTPAPAAAGGQTFASSGPAPVTSRPRAVAQNSARNTAARPASARDDSRQGADAASDGQGVALRANAAKPASLMDAAYAAYQAGKTTEATRLYQDVLRADPTQRDAWLGLAVIAHAGNQREPAMDAYKRVLRLEPQNATALAGLSSLITNAGEPQQESRLREMLARSPQEADLNNALGLVLSGEKRWSEAQPLFFKAHSAAPQEPQFAYNLAVTLDHLRKSGLAAQYYETAIGLAQGRASGFDEASARSRLTALKAGAAAGASR